MMPNRIPTYLRRYTDLPALLRLLKDRKLTLLDPKTWDDKNDSFYMSIYKDRRNLRTVLALCFSQSPETYHHWRVFSNGPAGVCIVFDRAKILSAFAEISGLSTNPVSYFTLRKAKATPFRIDNLPFTKRYGYKPENEFRAIYTSSTEELFALDVPITVDCIRRVSLSPWMHASLSNASKAAIQAIDGCARLKVYRSSLISNEQWMALGQAAS